MHFFLHTMSESGQNPSNNSPTKANAQNALHPEYNYFFTFTSEKTLHICSSPCPTLTVKINYQNKRGKTRCI